MKKLRIAQVAPLWYSVPPEKYGGIERIISFITEELVKRGHDVTLFASGNSKTKAKLHSVVEQNIYSMKVKWSDYWWNSFNHSVAFENEKDFDIIHCHWEIMGAFFQKLTPMRRGLYTFHNIPGKDSSKHKIYKYYEDTIKAIFISQSEKRNSKVKFKENWVVYNGIDISQFKFNPKPEDHFIWIARICRAKGTKEAILAAKKAGVKLVLAGQLQDHHKSYFEKEIKPLLGPDIKYVGELSQDELSDFYGSAKGCLYPIDWEEPFGLIMAESMACGTPVLVYDRGSAREVIEDKKTGFIVNSEDELVKAMGKIDQIKREDCRKRVEDNFTLETMVDEYEKVYYEIMKNS